MWSQGFCRYVEYYLAFSIAPRVIQTKSALDNIERKLKAVHMDALSKDALNEGVKQFPGGTWTRARRGGGWSGDLGSRRRLTG